MNHILEFLIVVASSVLVGLGAKVYEEKDIKLLWRMLLGGAMTLFGLLLFRHGLNYLEAIAP